MHIYLSKTWKGIFLLLVIFITMTGQFYFLEGGELDNLVFNADYIYLPTLYKSLLEDGDSLQSWYLTPAPYFFPDFIIYAIFKLLLGNFKLALIASNAFLFAAIGFLTYRLIAISQNKILSNAVLITGIAWFFTILINNLCGDYFAFHFLLTISNHTGNVFNTLLIALLFIHMLNQHASMWHYLLLFVLILSALISDNLFLLTAVVPLIMVVLVRLIIYRFRRNDIIHFFTWGLSVTAGLILSNNLRFFAYKTNKMKVKWEKAEQSLDYFLQTTDFFVTHFWPMVLLLAIAIVFSCILLTHKLMRGGFKILRLEDWILAGSLTGMLFSMGATVAGGLHVGIDTARYYIVPVYLFMFIALAYLISLLPFTRTGFYLIFIVTLMYGSYRFSMNGVNHVIAVHRYTPPDVARILSKAEELDLKNGISGYWYAKPLYLFSEGKLTVGAMYDRMFFPYLHICSQNWAYKPVFTFAVTTAASPIDRNILESITINKIPMGREDTLWVTQPFQLVKGEHLPRLLKK